MNSFAQNINYIAGLDNTYGSKVELYKNNLSLKNVEHDIELKFSYYNNDDKKIHSIIHSEPGVLVGGINDVLLAFKSIVESSITGSEFTCTISSYVQNFVVNNVVIVSIAIDSNNDTYKAYELELKVTTAGALTYDLFGEVSDTLKILPSLAMITSSDVSAIANAYEMRDEIVNVSNNIASVTAVGDSIENVNITGTNITNVNIVGDDIANVNTVSTHISNVDTVSQSITDVNTVSSNIVDVGIASTNIASINTVANVKNIADIIRVADDLNSLDVNGIADITIVANDLVLGVDSSIITVSEAISNVNITGNNIDNVNAVVANITDVGTVSTNIANVNITATDIASVNSVGSNISDVNIVSDGISNVNIVSSSIANIDTVATNITGLNSIASNIAEILQADENAAIAATKALEASDSAAAALQSSIDAEASAAIATTKANEASTSSISSATSAAEALDSANSADLSESNALAHKNSALASSQSARYSEVSASVSAALALESANSATNSASIATTKSSEAVASSVSAETSATNALASESNAATSETTATLKAAEASVSALESVTARDAILNMQVDTGVPGSEAMWDGTTLTVPAGINGYSVTSITSNKVGLTTTVTIDGNFSNAPYEFNVLDGVNGTGSGDMSKATYDTNNSGVVDNAEKVNGLTVETSVPAGALFTDTVTQLNDTLISTSTIEALTANQGKVLKDLVDTKQDTLISETNIKTINGNSIVGGGNISTIQTSVSGNAGTATKLETLRSIAISGDASGSANFDGSANANIAITLNSNVTTQGNTFNGPEQLVKLNADGKLPVLDGSNLTGIDGLPDQTGFAGKYLKTDGTVATWESASTGTGITNTEFVATAGQTEFTVAYTAGNLDVYQNGLLLSDTDYVATNGTSIVLVVGATTGDLVSVKVYNTFNVANTYTKAEVDAKIVEVSALSPILKPVIETQVNGTIDFTGTVVTDMYATSNNYKGTQDYVEWRFATDTGFTNIVDSYSGGLNLSSYTPAIVLPSTQVFAKVRKGSDNHLSAWSDTISFTTPSVYVLAPTVTVTGAPANIGRTPTITTSAFSVFNGSDTHLSTDWRVYQGGALVWESLSNMTNKLSIEVPSWLLAVSTEYTFEARHNGIIYGSSTYGSITGTTKANFSVAYGVQWNPTTDLYTRTGVAEGVAVSTSYAGNIQSLMRRCVLNANGTVNYYLNATNSAFREDGVTAADLTGASGNVMVQIPKFYYKYENVGGVHSWSVSLEPEVGYIVHPAFIKAGVEVPYRYYCAYEGYTNGSKLISRSGVTPTVSKTIATFRTEAIVNGTGWGLIDWNTLYAVQLLFLTEYADFDTQAMIGNGNDSGNDCTITTGQSNSIGNTSSPNTNDDMWMSYRGIENWYASMYKFIDGVNIQNRVYYVNNNPATYASDVFTGDYVAIGVTSVSTSGYVSNIIASNRGFVASAVAGSSSTFIPDYFYQNAGNTIMMFGGLAGDGLNCGGFFLNAVYASSRSAAHLGSGVCF